MPTIEYKYTNDQILFYVLPGIPKLKDDLIRKVTVRRVNISPPKREGCSVTYDLIGETHSESENDVPEIYLFSDIESAYSQLYNRLSEQIEVDEEKIEKLKNLRMICMRNI